MPLTRLSCCEFTLCNARLADARCLSPSRGAALQLAPGRRSQSAVLVRHAVDCPHLLPSSCSALGAPAAVVVACAWTRRLRGVCAP